MILEGAYIIPIHASLILGDDAVIGRYILLNCDIAGTHSDIAMIIVLILRKCRRTGAYDLPRRNDLYVRTYLLDPRPLCSQFFMEYEEENVKLNCSGDASRERKRIFRGGQKQEFDA